jgi:hydrogenase maturation protein HypF
VFDAAPVIRPVVADVVVQVAAAAAGAYDVPVVALSGGVCANLELLRRSRSGLAAAGLRVVTQRLVPCGDGGLSLGQAALAGRGDWTGVDRE